MIDLRSATLAEAEAYRAGLKHAMALTDVPGFAAPEDAKDLGLCELGQAKGATWFRETMRGLLTAALRNSGA